MKEHVIQAIRERRLLRVAYERNRHLTVAPLVLGETTTGYAALLCCQAGVPADDGETSWRLLDLERISDVQVLERHFGLLPRDRSSPGSEFSRIEAVV